MLISARSKNNSYYLEILKKFNRQILYLIVSGVVIDNPNISKILHISKKEKGVYLRLIS